MTNAEAPELVRIETPHGTFWTRENDFVTAQLRDFGGHQRSELGMLLSFVREGDVVCDIGAHIGTFSIPLARRVGAGGRVFAFEPVEGSRRILEKNVEANALADRLRIVHAIVTDLPGSYRLHVAGDHTSAAHFSLGGGAESGPPGPPSVRLDDWAGSAGVALTRLDVVKIDTEGMELRALRSAASLLRTHRPVIMAEMSGAHLARHGDTIAAVGSFLAQFGYRFFRNLGERHARTEAFALERLLSPAHGSQFFDLVAVHPTSDRFPEASRGPWLPLVHYLGRRARGLAAGVRRRLPG